MTRFEFLDRYKGFIPQSHATLFESDLYNTIHAEAWVERHGAQDDVAINMDVSPLQSASQTHAR